MKEYILTDLIKQYPKEFKYTIREYKKAGWDILNDDSIFAIVHHMIGYDDDEKIAHRMMRLGIADGEYIDKDQNAKVINIGIEPNTIKLYKCIKHLYSFFANI